MITSLLHSHPGKTAVLPVLPTTAPLHNMKPLDVSSMLNPPKNYKIPKSNLAHIGLKSSKPAIVRGIKFQMWFHIDFGPIVQVASRRQWETKLSSNRSTKSLSRSIIIMRAVPYFRHTNSFSLLECTYYVGFYFYYDSDFFVIEECLVGYFKLPMRINGHPCIT